MAVQYWQVAAGSFGRDYSNYFLKHGIAFVGGKVPIATMREVAVGDIFILKRGLKTILAVGEVVQRKGVHFGENDKQWLLDFDGWDLPAYCHVDWRMAPTGGVSTVGLTRSTIERSHLPAHHTIAASILGQPLVHSVPEPRETRRVDDNLILEFMVEQGLRPAAADELTNTIRKIRLLVNYYFHSQTWTELREHEIRTFLVAPFLLALGWAEQQIKLELPCSGGRIDLACFRGPYQRNRKECVAIIETKDFGSGLDYAKDQARIYARDFPSCQVLVATNGWCYKTFLRIPETGDFSETPSAYVNLRAPQDRYHLDPENTDGVFGVVKWLLPNSLR